jgi:hypothetical protein
VSATSTLGSIVDAWFLKAIEIYPEAARAGMMRAGDRFRNPIAFSLRESLTVLVSELAGGMRNDAVAAAVDVIVRVRAVQDCEPEEATAFAAQLHEVIHTQHAEALFPGLDQRLDALVLAVNRQYALCKQDIARVRSREAQRLQGFQPGMRKTL